MLSLPSVLMTPQVTKPRFDPNRSIIPYPVIRDPGSMPIIRILVFTPAPDQATCCPLLRDGLHEFIRNIKIGMHLLHVIVILQVFHQSEQRAGCFFFGDIYRVLRHHAQ
jgi:hypothetical protein